MNITCYASGSTGNFYSIDDGKTKLMIECGLPIKELQRLCGYTLSNFDACLLSHNHLDHAKSAREIQDYGVRLYCSKGTADALGVDYYQLKAREEEEIGTFRIIPFDVQHDCPEPLGFLVKSLVTGTQLVFLTDTFYTTETFPGTHIWMAEANYSKELIDGCDYQDRLFQSHMSLDTCIKTLNANDLSKTREIWLLHISQSHGDPERFVREVQEVTGIPTFAAPAYSKRGRRINLQRT